MNLTLVIACIIVARPTVNGPVLMSLHNAGVGDQEHVNYATGVKTMTIQIALIIIASFLAWFVRWICNRGNIPEEISLALAIGIALAVVTIPGLL